MENDKIVLNRVSYIYNPGTPFAKKALDDVSLRIAANRITGIIGHTGSGKSTMMMLLNGLYTPTQGEVLLDGHNINGNYQELLPQWLAMPEYAGMRKGKAKKAIREELKRRKKNLCFRVGLVMQYPEYQLFEETVYKDIAYGPKNMGLSEDEIKERVHEAIRFSGLEESLLQKSPFDLSGGQKRRVAIAGVIAMRPEVLVLDEPAAGLDPRGRTQIFEEVRRYQQSTGSTVIIVSHSMEDMAEYCRDLVVMANAKVVAQGSAGEVFSHVSMLENIGLDIPQISQLTRLLRAKGLDLPENIYTVQQAVSSLKALYNLEKGNR